MQEVKPYHVKNKIRIVTSASLFDGHDAAINIMRRIMQATGAEIIHLGHNRSVQEIVNTAIQEDVQGIAITSYQGGHIEFFKYMYDLLKERGAGHIKIFGGGGGTILPSEIEELQAYGIARLYSPDDGRHMGLQGMINDVLKNCDFPLGQNINGEVKKLDKTNHGAIARLISAAENYPEENKIWLTELMAVQKLPITHHPLPITHHLLPITHHQSPIIGITGTGGAGKSSLVDELVRRFLRDFEDKYIAIVSVDPSKRKTGGALLGDRIRMNAVNNDRVYMRSLATRQSNLALSKHVQSAVDILRGAHFDLIILETSGIGQSDTEIVDHSDVSLYVMTPEYGAATQLEKIDMLDFADLIAINKFDKRGGLDALRDVKKQYQRNHNLWDSPTDEMPVVGTIASQFNDAGMNQLYEKLMQVVVEKTGVEFIKPQLAANSSSEKQYIIPPNRTRYLSEISETCRTYDKWVEKQSTIARELFSIKNTLQSVDNQSFINKTDITEGLKKIYAEIELSLDGQCKKILDTWEAKKSAYEQDEFIYKVRGKDVKVAAYHKTLSGNKIPRVILPKFKDWGEILKWVLSENVPGEFPYAAGVFPFKREGEDPTRMFAGEGNPERTNRRFHYVSKGLPAKRLSTAFDSVTLYGEDPDYRPDIYGKVGNSGVSVCCLDDAKKLYSGFDLTNPKTSVSMTINGPAATITAFFMNAAIDQECEKYIIENNLQQLVEAKRNEIYGSHSSFITHHPLPITHHPSPITHHPLPITHHPLPITHHPLPITHHPSPITHHPSPITHYPLPITHYPSSASPQYNGEIPDGNNGLGLMLLGLSGDQILEPDIYNTLKIKALSAVRGTVQADILKEDQAQNTCIFSTEFSLKLMGDVQQYFIQHNIRNFYSVSISGYHIAEAGANPISQLAFTLSNGFTFVEYYVSRGMNIDDFAPNLSFFFSNGVDPEYAVIGRVARRIWAKAMKHKYGANERSQQLKYHIQTSGRSLHAQEIAFNDIRTTLQALYAIYDNCNSLHTNAYDEAITTPTEESVRRAMAIQLIINHELGLSKNENPLQGAFIIEELTDLVEDAVLLEFDRINERGGVLGAMETMYQRSKIQEESMHYEMLKHTGELPIIGVNTFLSSEGSPTSIPQEIIRAATDEKDAQIQTLNNLKQRTPSVSEQKLKHLQEICIQNGNIFEELMETVKYCSLGQITHALYEVGGQYRRNM